MLTFDVLAGHLVHVGYPDHMLLVCGSEGAKLASQKGVFGQSQIEASTNVLGSDGYGVIVDDGEIEREQTVDVVASDCFVDC